MHITDPCVSKKGLSQLHTGKFFPSQLTPNAQIIDGILEAEQAGTGFQPAGVVVGVVSVTKNSTFLIPSGRMEIVRRYVFMLGKCSGIFAGGFENDKLGCRR